MWTQPVNGSLGSKYGYGAQRSDTHDCKEDLQLGLDPTPRTLRAILRPSSRRCPPPLCCPLAVQSYMMYYSLYSHNFTMFAFLKHAEIYATDVLVVPGEHIPVPTSSGLQQCPSWHGCRLAPPISSREYLFDRLKDSLGNSASISHAAKAQRLMLSHAQGFLEFVCIIDTNHFRDE